MKWTWNIQNQLKISLLLMYNSKGGIFWEEFEKNCQKPWKTPFLAKKIMKHRIPLKLTIYFFSALMNEITWKKYNNFLNIQYWKNFFKAKMVCRTLGANTSQQELWLNPQSFKDFSTILNFPSRCNNNLKSKL